MRIQTKYDVTDRVWLLSNDKVHVVEIEKIEATVELLPNGKGYQQVINYRVRFEAGGSAKFSEDRLFETKTALINSL